MSQPEEFLNEEGFQEMLDALQRNSVPIVTSVGSTGSDTAIPTEGAVRKAINSAFEELATEIAKI